MDETNPKDLLGAKKPRLSLVSPAGLVYEALAMQNGDDKYGAYNWREKKVKAMIYLDACMRHLLAWQEGEELASDSGIPHLGHAKACIGILIDAKETGSLIDNRPKKGCAAAVLARYSSTAESFALGCCGDCDPGRTCVCTALCKGILPKDGDLAF